MCVSNSAVAASRDATQSQAGWCRLPNADASSTAQGRHRQLCGLHTATHLDVPNEAVGREQLHHMAFTAALRQALDEQAAARHMLPVLLRHLRCRVVELWYAEGHGYGGRASTRL